LQKLRPNRDLWKRTPAIVAVFSLFLLAAGFALAVSNANARLEQERSETAGQGQILASTVSAALSFNDRTAAQEYVGALRVNTDIQQAAVYDEHDRLFAGYHRAPGPPPPPLLTTRTTVMEGSFLTTIVPVIENGQRIGSVYIKVITDSPARRAARFAVIALLAAMVALVVAVLGAAQATLRRVNADLRQRSEQLAHANMTLVQQIAEREKAEEALRQAQKMEAIGHLTGGIAHDFNNLLQIILSSLTLLRRRSKTWPLGPDVMKDLDRYLDAACTGGERAAGLTRQLLAFARRQPLRPAQVDVNRLVEGMSELLRRTLGEAISIETQLSACVWDVFADVNQLENALVNLAVNARDAMDGVGRLTIATSNARLRAAEAAALDHVEPGDYVRIAVADTGCGMSADVIAKAFEPFFTTKDIGQGTGLGLSQVYGFVRQSGGHVTIESAVAAGTTINILLPRRPETGVQAEPVAERTVKGADAADLVLVVEDDPAVRAATIEMLHELGYRTAQADDGHAALRALDGQPAVRLLLSDVGLPGGMNGRQLADEVARRWPHIRILFTSGYTRDALIHGGRLDERVMLLSKPYTYADLAAKIGEVLNAE